MDIIPIDQLPNDDVLPVNQLPTGQPPKQQNPFISALQSAGKVAQSATPSPSNLLGQIPGMNIMSAQDKLSQQIKEQAKESTGFKTPILSDLLFDPRTYMGLGALKKSPEIALSDIPKSSLDEFSGKLVNSLIKPTHKQFLFGKNPGMGIAKEGITDFSLNGLGKKVEQRIGDINNEIKNIRSLGEHVDMQLDLKETIKPLYETLKKLSNAPRTHSEEIKRITDAITDLGEMKDINLSNATLEQAYNFKNIVRDMQNWTRESTGGTAINSALKQVYHEIDSKIDEAVPSLKQLNERLANMISAKQAISHRIEILSRHEPATFMNLIDAPFKAFKTPIVKTGLGKLLSERYPALSGK